MALTKNEFISKYTPNNYKEYIAITSFALTSLHMSYDASFLFHKYYFIPYCLILSQFIYLILIKSKLKVIPYILIFICSCTLYHLNSYSISYYYPVYLSLLFLDTASFKGILFNQKTKHFLVLSLFSISSFYAGYSKLISTSWTSEYILQSFFTKNAITNLDLTNVFITSHTAITLSFVLQWFIICLQLFTPVLFLHRTLTQAAFLFHILFHLFSLIFLDIRPVNISYLVLILYAYQAYRERFTYKEIISQPASVIIIVIALNIRMLLNILGLSSLSNNLKPAVIFVNTSPFTHFPTLQERTKNKPFIVNVLSKGHHIKSYDLFSKVHLSHYSFDKKMAITSAAKEIVNANKVAKNNHAIMLKKFFLEQCQTDIKLFKFGQLHIKCP